eukprot:m.10890 g.10890  ORF g.10890 m.10890 type:complete len:324 (-) comp3872_c0_seq2:184-1155(-)
MDDSTLLFSASYDNSLAVINASSGEQLCKLKSPADINCLDATSSLLAFGGDDCMVHVVRQEDLLVHGNKAPRATDNSHNGFVRGMRFSPDERLLVTGTNDNNARLFAVNEEVDGVSIECIRTFQGHRSNALAAAFSGDGTGVITGSLDSTVRLWDTETGTETRFFNGVEGSNGVRAVTWSADCNLIAYGTDGSHAIVLDVRVADSPVVLNRRSNRATGCTCVQFTPDGLGLGAAFKSQGGSVMDLRLGGVGDATPQLPLAYRWLSFTADGSHVAVCGRNMVCVYEVEGDVAANAAYHKVRTYSNHAATVVQTTLQPAMALPPK